MCAWKGRKNTPLQGVWRELPSPCPPPTPSILPSTPGVHDFIQLLPQFHNEKLGMGKRGGELLFLVHFWGYYFNVVTLLQECAAINHHPFPV